MELGFDGSCGKWLTSQSVKGFVSDYKGYVLASMKFKKLVGQRPELC